MLRRLSSSSRTFQSPFLHQPLPTSTFAHENLLRIHRQNLTFPRFASTTSSTHTARRVPRAVTLLAGFFVLSASYGLGVVYPPNIYTLIYPREAPPAAAKGSPRALEEAHKLETELWEIPIVKHLAAASYPLNADTVPRQFLGPPEITSINVTQHANPALTHYMARPYVNIPEIASRHSFTAGLLQGPGKLAIPPLLFIRTDEKAITGVIHLGRSICGHDGIVHGGLIATIFDDSFFRTAVANFPARIGVTAWLKINYRAPTKADQFVVFKTKVDKVEGRKVFVSGHMEDLEGNLLVEAEALFIQPRYAHLIQSEEREKHFLNRPAAIARTLDPATEPSTSKK